MSLLALDVATRTGWASWAPKSDKTEFGSIRFDGDLGEALGAFERWLKSAIRDRGITAIAVEAPLPMQGTTNLNTLLRLYGGYVLVLKVAAEFGIPVDSVNVGSWRAFFIGRATAPKEIEAGHKRRAWLKSATIEMCAKFGWDVGKDDNAADALGLLAYERAKTDPSFGSNATLLFRAA